MEIIILFIGLLGCCFMGVYNFIYVGGIPAKAAITFFSIIILSFIAMLIKNRFQIR